MRNRVFSQKYLNIKVWKVVCLIWQDLTCVVKWDFWWTEGGGGAYHWVGIIRYGGAYNTCINTVEFIWRCNAIPILYMCALPWSCNANNASLNQMHLKYFGEVESKHQAHWEWAPLSECALIWDDSTYSLNSVGKVIVTVTISRLNFSLTSTTGIWGPLHWVGTIIRGGCVTISDGSTYSLNSVAKVTVIVTILRLKSTTGI